MRHSINPRAMSGAPGSRQQGIVLVSAMIILVVLTLLAISSFRSFGLQERIAGNTRDKQMAFQVAQEALQYGEWWLTQNGSVLPTTCAAGQTATVSICNNTLTLAQLTSVPWGGTGTGALGFTYTPPYSTALFNVSSSGGGTNTYTISPRFYIAKLGQNPSATTGGLTYYQVTAMAQGGKANTVAVVQSVYSLANAVWCGGCL